MEKPMRFDWLMTLAATWLMSGVYLDGWAHNHIPELESFFTPWHGVLYSGFVVVALVLGVATYLNKRRSAASWSSAIPAGYDLAVLGVVLFALGGLGDMIWHTAWGVEEGIDALFSPTHLMLAIGAGFMVSGPMRAAWKRAGEMPTSLLGRLSIMLSWAYVLSLLTFMTQFIGRIRAGGIAPELENVREWMQQLGILYSLLYTTFSLGLFYIVSRRWKLPMGALTLVWSVNAFAMHYAITDQYKLIGAAFVAGVLADLAYAYVRPSYDSVTSFRLFSALYPALFYASFIIAVIATTGTWWSIHMWTGSIVIPAIYGWLLSYIALQPKQA